MFYIITKNGCETCKKALYYLNSKSINFNEINLDKTKIPNNLLIAMNNIENNSLKSFIRFNSDFFKSRRIDAIKMNANECQTILQENPKEVLSFPIILMFVNGAITNYLVGFSSAVLDRWNNNPTVTNNFYNINRAFGDTYCCNECYEREKTFNVVNNINDAKDSIIKNNVFQKDFNFFQSIEKNSNQKPNNFNSNFNKNSFKNGLDDFKVKQNKHNDSQQFFSKDNFLNKKIDDYQPKNKGNNFEEVRDRILHKNRTHLNINNNDLHQQGNRHFNNKSMFQNNSQQIMQPVNRPHQIPLNQQVQNNYMGPPDNVHQTNLNRKDNNNYMGPPDNAHQINVLNPNMKNNRPRIFDYSNEIKPKQIFVPNHISNMNENISKPLIKLNNNEIITPSNGNDKTFLLKRIGIGEEIGQPEFSVYGSKIVIRPKIKKIKIKSDVSPVNEFLDEINLILNEHSYEKNMSFNKKLSDYGIANSPNDKSSIYIDEFEGIHQNIKEKISKIYVNKKKDPLPIILKEEAKSNKPRLFVENESSNTFTIKNETLELETFNYFDEEFSKDQRQNYQEANLLDKTYLEEVPLYRKNKKEFEVISKDYVESIDDINQEINETMSMIDKKIEEDIKKKLDILDEKNKKWNQSF